MLAEIERKHNAAKDRATSLSAAREPYALKAARGDTAAQKALATLRVTRREAEMEVDDLAVAMRQAQGKFDEARSKAVRAERRRLIAEAQVIAAQRIEVALRIEAMTAPLADEIEQYKILGDQVRAITQDRGVQLQSRWRLDAWLNWHLGLDFVQPAQRVRLSEIERRVLDGALRYLEQGPGDGVVAA